MSEENDESEQLSGTWFAACDVDHPQWIGENRNSRQQAQDDATNHDIKRHGGSPTAEVISGA